jgi:hypothetical protein
MFQLRIALALATASTVAVDDRVMRMIRSRDDFGCAQDRSPSGGFPDAPLVLEWS